MKQNDLNKFDILRDEDLITVKVSGLEPVSNLTEQEVKEYKEWLEHDYDIQVIKQQDDYLIASGEKYNICKYINEVAGFDLEDDEVQLYIDYRESV